MTEHCFGEFRLDAADERLWGPDGPVKLGNKAYRVLLLLAVQPGRLVTKDDLFSSVWDGTIVSESALTSVIKEIRRALGDVSRTPRFIESVYGRGYRFIAPVTSREPSESPPPSPAFAATAAAVGPSLGQPPLLYVSPADDEAVRGAHPYLAETLREEILFTLARFREIRLISDDEPGFAEGHAACAERDYQLSLKLLARGETVRVFARLSRLSSREIIWAETADLDVGDIACQADRLVRTIAAAALPSLHDDVLRNLPQQPRDGYSLYFANRLAMRCQDSLEAAKALAGSWEELIERHPSFSAAYPPLIRLYNTDYCFTGFGSSGSRERARAYELAHRGTAIDPTDAALQSVKAWCHLWAGEAALAHRHFDEALRLNPYNQTRLLEAATGFMFLDDVDHAAALLERTRKLTPFANHGGHEEQALLHLLRHEFGLAADQFALVRRGHPDDRETTEPTILSELYALLAAAGAAAADVAARSERWQRRMRSRWSAEMQPDAPRLVQWALDHNPFESPARREWMLELLNRALAAAPPDQPRTPSPALRGRSSAPLAAESAKEADAPPMP